MVGLGLGWLLDNVVMGLVLVWGVGFIVVVLGWVLLATGFGFCGAWVRVVIRVRVCWIVLLGWFSCLVGLGFVGVLFVGQLGM